MENSPRVTVLCSTYNSSEWVDGYLKSINNLLLDEFNIVFVDANSTDGSLQTINDYVFRDGINKKVIECKARVSIYAAWNIAIKNCDTEYIINVNTDDRLFPAALDTYLNYASKIDADIYYGSCCVVNDSKHENNVGLYDWAQYSHEELLRGCTGGPFPFLKRQTIVDIGMFDTKYTISGDYEMWLRMSKQGKKFCKVKEAVGSYYYNPKGMSTNRESAQWQEHVRQDQELREIYK